MADSVGTLPLGALRQLDSQQRGGRQRVRERGAGRHTARPLGREKQPARGCGEGSCPDDGDGGGKAGWRAGEWSRRGAPAFPATTGGGRADRKSTRLNSSHLGIPYA